MHVITRLIGTLGLALFLTLSSTMAADAQGILDPYKAQGLVGERPDGFAGVVSSSAPADVAAKVRQVNDARRAEYARIAQQQGTTIDAVQAVFGKKLIARTAAGQYYMNPSGQWVKR